MKHFLWLFLLGAAYAQIQAGPTTGGGGTCTQTGSTGCNAPTTPNVNINAGDTIIAIFSGITNAVNVSIAGCNQTWPAVNRFTGTAFAGGIWIIPHAVAATNCNLQVGPHTNHFSFAFQIYSGASSVGEPVILNTANVAAAQSAPPITATSAGSFVVGMLFIAPGGTQSVGQILGPGATYRRGNGGTAAQSAVWIGDATATAAGQALTVSTTLAASVTARSVAVELVPAPRNRPALQSDQMHTVLMNAPRNMNYELPGSGLSASWCTWFMPIGPHTYALDPQDSRQLNGVVTDMHIPAWQMTRICQDESGNYWASPPLLAGTGISIAGSADGVRISAAAGAGGMDYVAGGTAHVPGTVAVPGGTCTAIYNSTSSTNPPATGVQQSDVVSWSLQPATVSTGWAEMNIYAQASADSVSWRACNMTASSATPSARDINWYVLRHSAGAVAAHHKVAKAAPPKKPVRPKK